MKQITVKVPDYQLQEIDETVKRCGYPSRAEFVRESIRENLQKHIMVRQVPPIRRG